MGIVKLYYPEVKDYIGMIDYMVYKIYTRGNNLVITLFKYVYRV